MGLDSYDMITAFGPITASIGEIYFYSSPTDGVGTSSGELRFDTVGPSATFQAIVSPVADATSSGALAAFSFVGTLVLARMANRRGVARSS